MRTLDNYLSLPVVDQIMVSVSAVVVEVVGGVVKDAP